jgi:hypothetical protein
MDLHSVRACRISYEAYVNTRMKAAPQSTGIKLTFMDDKHLAEVMAGFVFACSRFERAKNNYYKC